MDKRTITIPTFNAASVAKFFRNAINVLVVLLAILGSVLYSRVNNESNVATKAAEKILVSHCAFFRDIGTVKLQPSVTPQGQKVPPSRLGVQIVSDSRKAYVGIGCTPPLPPDPSLVHFAQVEHISLKGA